MKREIKFRAWIFEDKIMCIVYHWHKGDELDRIEVVGKRIAHKESYLSNEYELMQFTGLKDKNGREVYEGDIIQFDFGKDSKEGVINSQVIFKDGCFMYQTNPSKQVVKGDKWEQSHNYCNSLWWGPGYFPICGGFYGHGDLHEGDNSKSKITVIGNIHENPELL